MGSSSDLSVMEGAVEMLDRFSVPHEVRVVSAHRTPDEMLAFGHGAAGRGLRVLIAGAGGAAHLPGMLAAVTTLPVIGVPVALATLDGLDSLLSIVQMPRGVPVATVAVNGARNAGLLAVRILALGDPGARRGHGRLPGRAGRAGEAPGRRAHPRGPGRLSTDAGALRGRYRRGWTTSAERLGYDADAKLLILNADDLGFCHSANVGVFEASTRVWSPAPP